MKFPVDAALDALAEEIQEPVEGAPPKSAAELFDAGWRPNLNPIQRQVYDSDANYILADGERGSGKTIGATHKLVKHAFRNRNALAIIITGVKRQAEEGGVWHKLQTEVLPVWQHGNREMQQGRWTGRLLDDGIGIEFTEPKTNTAKDVFIWIKNRFGGWSRILLLSMPVEGFVADRVKGMEPSFVLVDEAQTLPSATYFTSIVQQVGRRPHITDKQQIIYCANPDGPSHWLYQRFFVYPVDQKTGAWNPKYARFHVPVSENRQNLPAGYWENVLEAVRGDEIEEARMVRGEWLDRPLGDALFKDYFLDKVHVRGNPAKRTGILPITGHPIIVSYDLGAAHSSITFEQIIPTKDRIWKLVVDELDFVGDYMPYFKLVPRLISRMIYWDTRLKTVFRWEHISDNSAFNQYRAKDGSFDAWDIEQLSVEYVEKNSLETRYIIRMRECPKGPHSIEARVRMLRDYLEKGELLVSAACPNAINMLRMLEEDKKAPLKPNERSPHTHRFDSLTYGLFYYDKGRGRVVFDETEITPETYLLGQQLVTDRPKTRTPAPMAIA